MMRHTTRIILLAAWFSLVALACNLSNPERPPTIVPRGQLAATPQATLGYATQVPGAVPQDTVEANQTKAEVEMYSLLNKVESDRLLTHIDALQGFYTRHVTSSTTSPDQGVGAAYNYIMQQFQAIQAQAPERFTVLPEGHQFDAHVNGGVYRQRNAVAFLQGTEPGAGTIVVGAHYDSRPDDQYDGQSFAPGADDNGSGVAAVLEMARILSQAPPRSTILFALFAAEEVDRQGSKAFVRDYIRSNNIDLIGMVNIDTIGSWNGSDGTINDRELRVFSEGPNDSSSRQLARMAEFVSFNYSLDLSIVMQDRIDREGRYGDHLSFQQAGYPAIRFIEAIEDHYNRESRDTIDKIEPAYLTASTRTILGFVLALANGPRPPRTGQITLRESGNGMNHLVWEPVPEASSYIVALRSANSLRVTTQFATPDSISGDWDGWSSYETVSVAAVDANGLMGPLSMEYKLP